MFFFKITNIGEDYSRTYFTRAYRKKNKRVGGLKNDKGTFLTNYTTSQVQWNVNVTVLGKKAAVIANDLIELNHKIFKSNQ